MNIGLHIAELLEERGKVSVQGVGTFYLKKTDAYFDEDRQMFFPKDRKLSFKLFEEDNSVFSKYLSSKEDISTVAANHVIKEFAIKFNNALGSTGTAEIRGIGKLKKEGAEYVIETFSSYGLIPLPYSGPVFFEPIETPVIPKKEIIPENKSVVDEEVASEPEVPIEENVPEEIIPDEVPAATEPVVTEEPVPEEELTLKDEIPEKEEIPDKEDVPLKEESFEDEVFEEEKEIAKERLYQEADTGAGNYDGLFSNPGDTTRRVRETEEPVAGTSSVWKWLIISFAALLFAGSVLGYLFYPKIKVFIQDYRSEQAAPPPAPPVQTPATPAVADSVGDSILTKQTDSIIAAAAAPAIKKDSVNTGVVTYEIIVASFARKSEADTYVSQWAARGQKLNIIERPLRTFKFKVSAGSFADQASAQKELSSVQQNISKEAWIDQVKN